MSGRRNLLSAAEISSSMKWTISGIHPPRFIFAFALTTEIIMFCATMKYRIPGPWTLLEPRGRRCAFFLDPPGIPQILW
jgi:hypothetical protein